jgi:hypothetical protein
MSQTNKVSPQVWKGQIDLSSSRRAAKSVVGDDPIHGCPIRTVSQKTPKTGTIGFARYGAAFSQGGKGSYLFLLELNSGIYSKNMVINAGPYKELLRWENIEKKEKVLELMTKFRVEILPVSDATISLAKSIFQRGQSQKVSLKTLCILRLLQSTVLRISFHGILGTL